MNISQYDLNYILYNDDLERFKKFEFKNKHIILEDIVNNNNKKYDNYLIFHNSFFENSKILFYLIDKYDYDITNLISFLINL